MKDPPAGYFYPATDVFGRLALIKSNLESGLYANEYAFQVDLYNIFALAHDGHFVMYPDLLSNALQWGRQLAVVSISLNGTDIPQIYAYEDVIANGTTPSVITLINGIDASTYIQDFAYKASFNQDADAAYNSMLVSNHQDSLQSAPD